MKRFPTIIRVVMLIAALLVPAIQCLCQTYGFSSSEIVMAHNDDARKIQDKGVLVVQKDGSGWIAQLSLGGDPGPVARLASLKVLTTKGSKYIKGVSNDLSFEINPRQLSILTGNYAIIFPNESLMPDYTSQYASLLSELDTSSSGTSNPKKPSSGSSSGWKAKSGKNTATLQPTTGNLTAVTFANHPFGFMPQGPMTQSKACDYLRQANWPSDPYDNSLMCIISSTPFKIPFKMYGKEVSTMSMSWYQGENTSYNLNVSDFKTNWTKNDAIHMAQTMYDELLKNGYKATDVRFTYSGHFFEKAVTNGSVYIQISASEHSKLASFDAFGIDMDVRYLQ